MATLTHEQQALLGTVKGAGVSAPGARLTTIVSIYLHSHTARKRGFVGDVAVQLSKRPLRGMPVCSSLFLARFVASLTFSAFADVCQVFQADETVWVLVYNASTDLVVAILLQPSLSPTHHHQTAGCGTTSFAL